MALLPRCDHPATHPPPNHFSYSSTLQHLDYLDYVRNVSGGYLKGIWGVYRVSRGGSEGVWRVSLRCLKNVLRVSGDTVKSVLSQDRSSQVRPNQVRSGQVKSG